VVLGEARRPTTIMKQLEEIGRYDNDRGVGFWWMEDGVGASRFPPKSGVFLPAILATILPAIFPIPPRTPPPTACTIHHHHRIQSKSQASPKRQAINNYFMNLHCCGRFAFLCHRSPSAAAKFPFLYLDLCLESSVVISGSIGIGSIIFDPTAP